MKKTILFAAVALVAIAFSACGNKSPKANLKNDVDTLSYAMGIVQSQGLKQYLASPQGIDTAYIDEFIKGLNEVVNGSDDKKKAAYYAGIMIGQQIASQMVPGINQEVFGNDSTKTISLNDLLAGFAASLGKEPAKLTLEQAQKLAQTKSSEIKKQYLEKEYGANKKAGEKFLADNAKKEGVKILPSGVQYKVIKEGNGPLPKDTSKVTVQYEGRTIDGKVFDSSYKRGQPAEFVANQVIKGWTEALTHMPVGSVWEVYIPQDLAYGEREQPGLFKPFSALVFKIELIGINK